MNNFRWQLNRPLAPVLLALALAAAPLHAGAMHYLSAGQPDAVALLAPPPLPDSPEQAADLAEVQAVAHAASSNEIAAAHSEHKFTVFVFAPAIGDFFQAGKFPRTEKFLRHVQNDADDTAENAKKFWKRPRPYVVDTNLAGGKLEKTFSYPSAHSTESMTLALVLADLFPDKHDAIMAEARLIGWHRVEIARHYPTDIYAGRVFAQAIVREMKKNADFQKDFAWSKAELAARQ